MMLSTYEVGLLVFEYDYFSVKLKALLTLPVWFKSPALIADGILMTSSSTSLIRFLRACLSWGVSLVPGVFSDWSPPMYSFFKFFCTISSLSFAALQSWLDETVEPFVYDAFAIDSLFFEGYY